MNPSLALIPCAFDTGKLYSVLPDTGLGDFTVSRNGTATYLGADGLIKTSLVNEPRLEFNPDGSFKGVLVESASTNLILRSEEFENVRWTKTSGVTVTANAEISPRGTMDADFVQFGASNRIVNQSTSLGVGITATGSFFIKGTSGQTIQMAIGGVDVLFTLSGIWQRIIGTHTSISSSLNLNTFGGATARNVFIWGAQLEVGSVATSYIPTVASTVTRPADMIRVQEPSGITQIKTINNNIETTTTPTGGLFTLPNGNIKRVLML